MNGFQPSLYLTINVKANKDSRLNIYIHRRKLVNLSTKAGSCLVSAKEAPQIYLRASKLLNKA